MARTFTPLSCHVFSCLLFAAFAEQPRECSGSAAAATGEGNPTWVAAEAGEAQGLEMLQMTSQKVSNQKDNSQWMSKMYTANKAEPTPQADWKCHTYRKAEGENNEWCQKFPRKDGMEYAFTGGVFKLCGDCWCCSRKTVYDSESDDESETGQLIERSNNDVDGGNWKCHMYDKAANQNDDWCMSAGVQGGFEYSFSGGESNKCGNCWCCKREASQDSVTSGYNQGSQLMETAKANPWQCHLYSHGEDDNWCKMMRQWSSKNSQWEYEYTDGKVDLCGDCWCCKKSKVKESAKKEPLKLIAASENPAWANRWVD